MRAEQRKVVDGMVAASHARRADTGRGLQNTGSTAKAFDGEEVDWYCCNVGAFHVKRATDPSVAVVDDEDVRRWMLDEDMTIVTSVAVAIGPDALAALVTKLTEEAEWLKAAKVIQMQQFCIRLILHPSYILRCYR